MLDPNLPAVLEEWLRETLNMMHFAMPAKVKSYDAATQTAEVIPVIKQSLLKPDGRRAESELPVIPNVRVMWPRAGGCYIHFPMAAGDYVQLVFNECSIAQWRETGQISPPGDLARNDLSYPYAYPGGWPDAGAFGTLGPVVVVPSALTVCSEGGTASAQFVALANLVKARLDTIQAVFDTHVHASAGAPPSAPIGPLAAVAATKLKAE